ncbi:hypothetical protein QOT17_004626 [Balamuthia mandrillaris]
MKERGTAFLKKIKDREVGVGGGGGYARIKREQELPVSHPHYDTFRHGLHIGCDEEGNFNGVPDEWVDELLPGGQARKEKTSTEPSYSLALPNNSQASPKQQLPPVISPRSEDLAMLHRTPPASSTAGSIRPHINIATRGGDGGGGSRRAPPSSAGGGEASSRPALPPTPLPRTPASSSVAPGAPVGDYSRFSFSQLPTAHSNPHFQGQPSPSPFPPPSSSSSSSRPVPFSSNNANKPSTLPPLPSSSSSAEKAFAASSNVRRPTSPPTELASPNASTERRGHLLDKARHRSRSFNDLESAFNGFATEEQQQQQRRNTQTQLPPKNAAPPSFRFVESTTKQQQQQKSAPNLLSRTNKTTGDPFGESSQLQPTQPPKQKKKLKAFLGDGLEKARAKGTQIRHKAGYKKGDEGDEEESDEEEEDDDDDDEAFGGGCTVASRLQRSFSASNGGQMLNLSGLGLERDVPTEAQSKQLTAALMDLNLSHNCFADIPTSLPLYSNLQELNLSGNRLTQLSLLDKLPKLKALSLNGNQLTRLPATIAQCSDLEKLELRNNQLQQLPLEIGFLTKLEDLHLTGNPLSSLPPSIGYLANLEVLDVSSCGLRQLPEELSYCFRLIELDLGNNNLGALPQTLGLCSRLGALNLCDNQLTDLPLSLGFATALSSCIADRNNFVDQTLVAKHNIGTDHLLDYLAKRLASSCDSDKYMAHLMATRPKLPALQQRTNDGTHLHLSLQPQKQKGGSGFQPRIQVSQAAESSSASAASSSANPTLSEELRKKITRLRQLSKDMATSIRDKLRELKLKLSNVTQVEQGIPLAKIARSFKEDMVAIQTLTKSQNPVWVELPPSHPSEDKLIVLKRTIANSFDNVGVAIQAIMSIVNKSEDVSVIFKLINHLKSLYNVFLKADSTPSS